MANAAAASPFACKENVYMVKLAEPAERHEEMVEFMEKASAAADSDELSVEERNLIYVAYKNVIGARRASRRIISSIEQKEKSRGNEDYVSAIRDYRPRIKSELSDICTGILKLARLGQVFIGFVLASLPDWVDPKLALKLLYSSN